MGVELLKGDVGYPPTRSYQTPNTVETISGSESARDNLRGQKGNNPDRLLRSQNQLSSLGSYCAETARMLA